MIKTIIALIIGIWLEYKYSPRLDYVKDSKLLLLYYTSGNTRKYVTLFKL